MMRYIGAHEIHPGAGQNEADLTESGGVFGGGRSRSKTIGRLSKIRPPLSVVPYLSFMYEKMTRWVVSMKTSDVKGGL